MNLVITLSAVALALVPATLHPERLLIALVARQPMFHTAVNAPDYQPVAIPVRHTQAPPLQLGAASWYAVDITTGQSLTEHNAATQRPIASVTKMVTALVISRTHKPNEIVTVPKLPQYQPADELIGLQAGEKLTIHDLLAALLINSANDAADTLAIVDSGSREAFATKMNAFVKEWGITDATFSNPSGLSDTGNGASAKALVQIAQLGLHNQTFRTLVATPSLTITTKAGRTLSLTNTNKLLQNNGFSGIKTGYTPAAGECFVGLTTVQGHQVITVVLGSQDRFGDTQKLRDWINTSYTWQPPQ